MDTVFVDKVTDGKLAPYLRPDGFRCDIDGISILAMPPGHVDLDIKLQGAIINTVPSTPATFSKVKVNGTPVELATAVSSGSAYLPSGTDFLLQCQNHAWECLIEFTDAKLASLVAEQLEDFDLEQVDHSTGVHPSSAILAQMAIDHLRQPLADRLYLEGLAIAMTANAVTFAAPGKKPSTYGTDKRISRALDYIHAHLATGLTVGDLAMVACMSPSWFTRAFKSQTGKTVHAYVLEHRLEKAREALITTNEPIGNIAYACGFSDHSHLTRLFRRRYGMTPSDARG